VTTIEKSPDGRVKMLHRPPTLEVPPAHAISKQIRGTYPKDPSANGPANAPACGIEHALRGGAGNPE
jgi:hypothetical protein